MAWLAALLALFVNLVSLPGAQETKLTLYYTASLNGSLDGCTCEWTPAGGLVKRAVFLRHRPDPESSLLLDAGNLLNAHPDPALADEILAVYGELGYTAVAVGGYEFANGIQALMSYRERVALLCHNLSLSGNGKSFVPFSQEPLLATVKGLRIGIFALLEPESLDSCPRQDRALVRISPPAPRARSLLEVCRRRGAALTILLYHGRQEAALRLAREAPGIDLILFAQEQKLVPPYREGGTIFASPGELGNRVGILTLTLASGKVAGFVNSFRYFNYRTDADDPSVRDRVNRYRQALRSLLKPRD